RACILYRAVDIASACRYHGVEPVDLTMVPAAAPGRPRVACPRGLTLVCVRRVYGLVGATAARGRCRLT
ncbi:hypothetical protein EBZ80_27865, partial [bacterium]|nr:hypothetical protein [bacterium]